MTEPCALASDQKSVNNLSYDQRSKNLAPRWGFDEPNQSDDRVEQIGVDGTHVHRPCARLALFEADAWLPHDWWPATHVRALPETTVKALLQRPLLLVHAR